MSAKAGNVIGIQTGVEIAHEDWVRVRRELSVPGV